MIKPKKLAQEYRKCKIDVNLHESPIAGDNMDIWVIFDMIGAVCMDRGEYQEFADKYNGYKSVVEPVTEDFEDFEETTDLDRNGTGWYSNEGVALESVIDSATPTIPATITNFYHESDGMKRIIKAKDCLTLIDAKWDKLVNYLDMQAWTDGIGCPIYFSTPAQEDAKIVGLVMGIDAEIDNQLQDLVSSTVEQYVPR